MNTGDGERALKRCKLEALVGDLEAKKKQAERAGIVFKGVTKAELNRCAGVGKNYIDSLPPKDPLARRIKTILKTRGETRAKHEQEQVRLEINRELQAVIQDQGEALAKLRDENNRLRATLKRKNELLAAYERDYEAKNYEPPSLQVVKTDNVTNIRNDGRDND